MANVTLVRQTGTTCGLVTFPSAEVALATLQRWSEEDKAAGQPYGQMWAVEDEDHQVGPAIGPLTEGELALLEYLYPTCHHGLGADLCMDPVGDNHWGSIEDEMRRGW